MTGIYKFTSKTTGKSYIGLSIDIETRYKNHMIYYKTINNKFYNAMREQGVDNFTFEIIEECNKESLSEREIYWIAYYNSYNNGYNSTPGGYGVDKSVCGEYIEQYTLDGQYIATYTSIRESARATNIDPSCIIRAVNHEQKQSNGFLWRRVNDEITVEELVQNYRQRKSCNTSTRVAQYGVNHTLIREYNSIQEAATKTGITRSNITRSCQNNNFSAGGYYWKYLDTVEEIIPTLKYNSVMVEKLDNNMNVLDTYPSIAEAARANNIKQSGNIGLVCQGKRHTCGGFIWRYASPKH